MKLTIYSEEAMVCHTQKDFDFDKEFKPKVFEQVSFCFLAQKQEQLGDKATSLDEYCISFSSGESNRDALVLSFSGAEAEQLIKELNNRKKPAIDYNIQTL